MAGFVAWSLGNVGISLLKSRTNGLIFNAILQCDKLEEKPGKCSILVAMEHQDFRFTSFDQDSIKRCSVTVANSQYNLEEFTHVITDLPQGYASDFETLKKLSGTSIQKIMRYIGNMRLDPVRNLLWGILLNGDFYVSLRSGKALGIFKESFEDVQVYLMRRRRE
jgi:hypothetical protein